MQPRRATVSVTVSTLAQLRPRQVRRPIDVEDLLRWVYAVQRAHIAAERGLAELEALRGGSSSATEVVARVLRLGVIVDRSGPDRGELHPDAERVHRVVMQMDRREAGISRAGLLVMHAKAGDRPDAMVGQVPRPVPVLTVRGRILTEWTDAGRRCGFCPLTYEPSAIRILQAREEWEAWHAGLRLVALALQGERLELWRVLPPAVPRRPWEAQPQPQP